MKRILAILLTFTMLLSLAACGGKEEPSIKDNIPATEAPTEAPTEPPKDPNLGKVFNVGDYEFTYLESFIIADANGKPVVVVHFDYANHNTKKDYAFWHMHSDSTVTQNGEELEYARVKSPDGSINYDDTTYEKVGNGNHTEVYEAYYLVDGTSPVTMFYACMGEEGTAEFMLDLSFAEIIGEVEFPTEPESTEAPTEVPTEAPTEAPTEPPFVGTTYTTDKGYVTITTMEGWDKGAPNSNFALTLFPGDSKSRWVDIDDTQLSTLQETMDHIQSGYAGTVWTEMTIGSNVFQYLVTSTGVHYLAADTSSGKAFYMEVRGVALEDVLPMLETIVIG